MLNNQCFVSKNTEVIAYLLLYLLIISNENPSIILFIQLPIQYLYVSESLDIVIEKWLQIILSLKFALI